MKWAYRMFNIKHVHCYSKKNRLGIMECHACGLWKEAKK